MITEFGVKNNNKDPKFELFGHVRISKYKKIHAKGHIPNVSWIYVISDLKGEKIVRTFHEKELQKNKLS